MSSETWELLPSEENRPKGSCECKKISHIRNNIPVLIFPTMITFLPTSIMESTISKQFVFLHIIINMCLLACSFSLVCAGLFHVVFFVDIFEVPSYITPPGDIYTHPIPSHPTYIAPLVNHATCFWDGFLFVFVWVACACHSSGIIRSDCEVCIVLLTLQPLFTALPRSPLLLMTILVHG